MRRWQVRQDHPWDRMTSEQRQEAINSQPPQGTPPGDPRLKNNPIALLFGREVLKMSGAHGRGPDVDFDLSKPGAVFDLMISLSDEHINTLWLLRGYPLIVETERWAKRQIQDSNRRMSRGLK